MAFVLFTAERRRGAENMYARRLAAMLGAAVVPIAGSEPVGDAAARASARAAWQALDAGIRPLIAGEVLSAFAPLCALFRERRAAILIDEQLAAAPAESDVGLSLGVASGKGALASAPLVLASSEAAAEAIAGGNAVPRERICVVEPPTPALPRAVGSGGGETVIFVPDAAGPGMAHEVLFRALAGLLDLEWRVCIRGRAAEDAEDAAARASLAARFGLATRLHYECRQGSAEDERLWRESDLFATAVAGRGYGFATAAAMKRGLPVVIAGDAKSAPAIPAEAGAIAPPGDHVQLAKALRRLIFDRDLRREMAEAAWQRGKRLPTEADVQERLSLALV